MQPHRLLSNLNGHNGKAAIHHQVGSCDDASLLSLIALARMLEEMGMDYVNVSAGIPPVTPEIVRPTKNYPEGVYRHFG